MDSFLHLVEEHAQKIGFTFVLDSGEGRELENPPDDMYVEDVSGWLMTAEELRKVPHVTRKERDHMLERNDLRYVIARWFVDEKNTLQIQFEDT